MIDFLLIAGKRGHGKTQWLRRFMQGWKRVFLFDPTCSFPMEYVYSEHEFMDCVDAGDFEPGKAFSLACCTPDIVPLFSSVGFIHGDIFIAIDEASLIFPNPRQQLDEWASHLTLLGRHARITVAVVAQRAASIPITMRTQASRVVSFKQTEKNDLQALSGWFGDDTKTLPLLEPLECLDTRGRSIDRYTIEYKA